MTKYRREKPQRKCAETKTESVCPRAGKNLFLTKKYVFRFLVFKSFFRFLGFNLQMRDTIFLTKLQ